VSAGYVWHLKQKHPNACEYEWTEWSNLERPQQRHLKSIHVCENPGQEMNILSQDGLDFWTRKGSGIDGQ